jgi:hypothetical protein
MKPLPDLLSVARPAAACLLATLAAFGAQAADAASAPPAPISLTGAPATADAPSLPAGEAALLGAWMEGFTPEVRAQLATLPPERADELRAHLGDTLVFRSDHTLRIFPRCEQAAQIGAGPEGLGARWELVDGRILHVSAERGGQPIDRRTRFRIAGDELSFFDNMAAKPQVMGRYDGPLPPRCP